jgi:hypothetical protein
MVDLELSFTEGLLKYNPTDWVDQEDAKLGTSYQHKMKCFTEIDVRKKDLDLTDEHYLLMPRHTCAFGLRTRTWSKSSLPSGRSDSV